MIFEQILHKERNAEYRETEYNLKQNKDILIHREGDPVYLKSQRSGRIFKLWKITREHEKIRKDNEKGYGSGRKKRKIKVECIK